MSNEQPVPNESVDLRRRAEEQVRDEMSEANNPRSTAQTQRLNHELRVHRIELELQNEELRESRSRMELALARYTEIYDFAPVGYFTLLADSTIRELNLAGAKLLGLERARLKGGRFNTFVSLKTRSTFDSWLTSAFGNHIQPKVLLELITDGRPPLFVEIDATLSADGQELRTVAVDVTERIVAEQARAHSEQRLQAVMQAVPVGVSFSTDSTCQVIRGNATLLAQFEGTTEDNMSASSGDKVSLGRKIRFFRDGVEVSAAELPLQRAIVENKEVEPIELEVLQPSGRKWIAEASGAPIRDADGSVIAGVAVTLDITERKRVQDALREAHRQLADKALQLEALVEERTAKLQEAVGDLETFSYSIAHDMRAPLRSLQGFSNILLDEYADKLDAEGLGFLHRIANSASRMDRLIQDVLNYSKVLRSDFPLEPIEVDRLIKEILDGYPMFGADHAEVSIQLPLPLVLGNEAMLTQIFSNLIGNAIKFVAPGVRPRIRIWGESAASCVRIFVEDNGIGIEPAHCERIFEMFQQVSKNFEGTGIGLAIVKKAVERMGGKVGVQPQTNNGSIFWIEMKPG